MLNTATRLVLAALLTCFSSFAVADVICTEADSGGCVVNLPVGGITIAVASDGEVVPFDPFGYGANTSDGIQFSDFFVASPGLTDWVNLPGTRTWVLPEGASDAVGMWYAPNEFWSGTAEFDILEPGGLGISDQIFVDNNGPGGVAELVFKSVPEPATLSLLGLGLAGLGFARRRRAA